MVSPIINVITLNTWGGRRFSELLDFVISQKEVDVWCFQEVFETRENFDPPTRKDSDGEIVQIELFSALDTVLSEYTGYFTPFAFGHLNDSDITDQSVGYGIAMFISNHIEVITKGHRFIFGSEIRKTKSSPPLPRVLQFAHIRIPNNNDFVIVHFHGLWQPNQKEYSIERSEQSAKLLHLLFSELCISTPTILLGDFNLQYDNPLFDDLLDAGYNNHIRINNVKSTRSTLYSGNIKCGDYIITDSRVKAGLTILEPQPPVSDHLPLLLEVQS
jgi:hypothetical protein